VKIIRCCRALNENIALYSLSLSPSLSLNSAHLKRLLLISVQRLEYTSEEPLLYMHSDLCSNMHIDEKLTHYSFCTD